MDTVVEKKYNIRYPSYASYHSRLITYYNAFHSYVLTRSNKLFADAGFFYNGEDDETICYYCGGGLKFWQDDDNPWDEHARWFPRCPYVLVMKGKGFVQQFQDKSKTHPEDFVQQFQDKSKTHPVVLGREAMESQKEEEGGEEGNEKDSERNNCLLCLSSERGLLFLPCRHFCTCCSCGLMYNYCIFCRTRITSYMKIYMV